jgi:hypothetical protein
MLRKVAENDFYFFAVNLKVMPVDVRLKDEERFLYLKRLLISSIINPFEPSFITGRL